MVEATHGNGLAMKRDEAIDGRKVEAATTAHGRSLEILGKEQTFAASQTDKKEAGANQRAAGQNATTLKAAQLRADGDGGSGQRRTPAIGKDILMASRNRNTHIPTDKNGYQIPESKPVVDWKAVQKEMLGAGYDANGVPLADMPATDQRVRGRTYMTPSGPHQWVGNGWKRIEGASW